MFDKKSGSKITYGIVGLGRFGQALARRTTRLSWIVCMAAMPCGSPCAR